MATYQREVRIDAPLDEVWEFYSRASGLEAVTPDWMRLRVEAVRGPNGEIGRADVTVPDDVADPDDAAGPDDVTDPDSVTDSDVLEVGSKVRVSIRPFGVGPRQRWTSVITRREKSDGAAVFEDEMHDGPFPEWRHAHHFYAVGDEETLVRDRVEYELPVVGGLLGPLGWLGFEPMFRERHRRTKALLERDQLRTEQ